MIGGRMATAEALDAGVYKRSQARRKAKISARRAKRGGVGRTDGPRKRKGEPSYLKGKRLRMKHRNRLLDAPEKTLVLLAGTDIKTGRPVLRFEERAALKTEEVRS